LAPRAIAAQRYGGRRGGFRRFAAESHRPAAALNLSVTFSALAGRGTRDAGHPYWPCEPSDRYGQYPQIVKSHMPMAAAMLPPIHQMIVFKRSFIAA
jgi:hypothetical protein